jgi:hypothetical protein
VNIRFTHDYADPETGKTYQDRQVVDLDDKTADRLVNEGWAIWLEPRPAKKFAKGKGKAEGV